MTLALLLTAATGAWAGNVEAKIGTTEYATLAQAISSAQDGDIIQLQSDAALTESIIVEKRITIDYNGYIISRVGNTYGGIFWAVDMTFTDSDDTGRGGMKCYYGLYTGSNAKANLCGGRYDDSAETILTGSYNIPTGYEIVNINAEGSADADGFISRVVRNYLNDTKTVATMTMPAFDATVNYELVRDMSVQMTAQVGDGTQEQPRYRVKKDGNNWIPADLQPTDIPGLFSVIDGIENNKVLTQTTDYIVKIYAIDEQGQPTGDPMTFATFTFEPGIYAVKAVAADGSDYDGETALSNTFKLFQGYEIEVPAGEFATFYKDEPLYADTETSADAVLYTVSSVSADKAVLSSAITTAPSLTPLLVFNSSEVKKTFLLIPADAEPNLVLTVAPEFVGTLEATTIAASTDEQNNYALNGKQFVWVKDALAVNANKAWLAIPTNNARQISIVFGDATAISAVSGSPADNNSFYDLSGRKVTNGQWSMVNGQLKKGIVIVDGKKVVVK